MKFKIFSPSKGLDRLCNGTGLTITPKYFDNRVSVGSS